MNAKTMATAMADAKALITTLELPYLRELQTILADEIRSRDNVARRDAIVEIQKIAESVGMTVQEVLAIAQKPKAERKPTKPVEVKYKHPYETTKHWTGRGMRPSWIKAWLAEHGNLDALKVAA